MHGPGATCGTVSARQLIAVGGSAGGATHGGLLIRNEQGSCWGALLPIHWGAGFGRYLGRQPAGLLAFVYTSKTVVVHIISTQLVCSTCIYFSFIISLNSWGCTWKSACPLFHIQVGSTLRALVAGSPPVQLRQRLLKTSSFDSSSVVLLLMAVGTLVGGSMWAGHDHLAAKKQQLQVRADRIRISNDQTRFEFFKKIKPLAL